MIHASIAHVLMEESVRHKVPDSYVFVQMVTKGSTVNKVNILLAIICSLYNHYVSTVWIRKYEESQNKDAEKVMVNLDVAEEEIVMWSQKTCHIVQNWYFDLLLSCKKFNYSFSRNCLLLDLLSYCYQKLLMFKGYKK